MNYGGHRVFVERVGRGVRMNGRTTSEVIAGLDLADRVCVVTGAGAGLGRESSRALAAAGAHVILAGRDPRALERARRWIAGQVPDARTSQVILDLASLSAVRSAAAVIADLAPRIDVLMNNAGVMFTPFGRTADGFEMQFGTNHLGHFELTRLLLPQLAAGGARIVILSSHGHHMSDVDLADPHSEHREYDKFLAYGASKTANLLHMVELNRRFAGHGVCAFAVHPGLVATSLARHMTAADLVTLQRMVDARPGRGRQVDLGVLSTPEQGAATQVWAAVSPELVGAGPVYLADCAISADAEPYAIDPERARRLWELSAALCD